MTRMSRPYDGRGRLNRDWQPPREGRNGHQTIGLYGLWALALVLIGLILILGMAASGCIELENYGRQHGWN